jgi:N-methylhydantoinase A
MARVAETAMARALRRVSAERGIDPSGFSLLAFGGAGPLFACSLARLLGVREVIVPPLAGALSAWGMAGAADGVEATLSVHLPARDFQDRAPELARVLARRLAGELPGAKVAFLAECRYRRQGYELEVSADPRNWKSVASRFHAAHLRRFAHRHQGATVEVINLRAVARGRERALPAWREPVGGGRGPAGRRRITLAGGDIEAQLVRRELLASDDVVAGPAIVEGSDSTALVPPGWAGAVHRSGALILEGHGVGTG